MTRDASVAASRWRTVLSELLKDGLRLDRTQSDPVVSARNALGVAAPLAIGALAGSAAYGLPSTIGALQTAFADRPGPYRLRVLRMSATAVTAAVTGGLAVALSANDFASTALLFVVAFVGGLLVSGGPAATQVGIAGTVAPLVLGHQVTDTGAALHVGLLVLAGGAGQVLLAVAGWPLRRHLPERRALSGLYTALAELARSPATTSVGPPLGDLLGAVRSTLYGLGHDHGPSVEAYRVLLDEAERVRRELIVLGGYAERLDTENPAAAERLRGALADTAAVLSAVGTALESGRLPEAGVPARTFERIAAVAHDLDSDDQRRASQAAAARLRTLLGQLRAAVETATAGASEGRIAEPRPSDGGRRSVRLRDPIATVRANLSPDSVVLRHAVRAAVLVAGSDLVLRLAGVDHGYWVPLTIMVVLRPDFATTFQRATMRVGGTIVGLVLATGLVHFVPGGQWYAVALIALFFFVMRLAGPGNLAIGAAALSALVVVLLSLAGVAPHRTIDRRAVDTLIGGGLALVAVLLRASWERDVLRRRLADLLIAYRRYTDDVADFAYSPARLQRSRSAARVARTNAEASVDRAGGEPVSRRDEVELGRAVLAHSHRYVHALLALDTARAALRDGSPPAELGDLLAACSDALDRCAEAVLHGGTPSLPDLRATHDALVSAMAGHDGGLDAETVAAVIDATDRMVDGLSSLADEMARQESASAS